VQAPGPLDAREEAILALNLDRGLHPMRLSQGSGGKNVLSTCPVQAPSIQAQTLELTSRRAIDTTTTYFPPLNRLLAHMGKQGYKLTCQVPFSRSLFLSISCHVRVTHLCLLSKGSLAKVKWWLHHAMIAAQQIEPVFRFKTTGKVVLELPLQLSKLPTWLEA